jgi:diguanylate cyclase (GGDEF)-like protein
VKYFNELCILITKKYNIDYIVIDKDFKIEEFSDGIINFTNTNLKKTDDIRDYFYEFVGYEDKIESLVNKKSFELDKVNKEGFYINIYVKRLTNQDNFIILVEDITNDTILQQRIWQDRNNKELMIKEISHDMRLQEISNRQLNNIAKKDDLTKLLNRLGLDSQLNNLIKLKKEFILMFLDLDNFKYVNDTYGHHYGDILLCDVSKRLKESVDKDSILSRYGGDEFIIILFNIDIKDLEFTANKIIDNIKQPYFIEHQNMNIGVSIGGIEVKKNNTLTKNELIDKADEAMYISKRNGKNRFSYIE